MSEPIRSIKAESWFIDTEYVPCIQTGRRVYGLDSSITDEEVLAIMYSQAGATPENPRPMLKSVMYRIVSVAAVVRKVAVLEVPDAPPALSRWDQPKGPDVVKGDVELHLFSRPSEDNFDERAIIERFLKWIGERKVQVVGFASSTFDIPTLFQRAVVLGIEIPEFCQRPPRAWDNSPDYFNDRNQNNWNVDLMRVLGGYGKTTPSLAEIARACGVPAKVGGSGADVAGMWFSGRRRDIVNYNECDALTTYLLWLHTARTCGLLSGEDVEKEGILLFDLLQSQLEAKPHLQEFLDQWKDLQFIGSKPIEPAAADAVPETELLTGEERAKLLNDAWDALTVYYLGDEVTAIQSLSGRRLDELSSGELQQIIKLKGAPMEVQHAAV